MTMHTYAVSEQDVAPPPRSRVVAVIPAFNEERFIASVVLRTCDHADRVIVVDDGSSDATDVLAERAGATVVRLLENRGKAAALRAGFQAALEYAPEAIVCLDADAQHDPSEIPQVTTPILDGSADVVIGTRFRETQSAIPAWRQVGQHALTAVTNALSGVRVSDSQSGFRAFSPAAAQALKFKSGGLSVESEMQFLFEPAGLRVAEVPISVHYLDGNKRNPVVHGLQVLDAMLSLIARRRPLRFFALPGAVSALLGLGLGVMVTMHLNRTGELLVGSALVTVLLLLIGLLLGVTGITLHSIRHVVEKFHEEFELLKEHFFKPL